MRHLVVWTGPIKASNLPDDALPPGSVKLTINQTGDGTGSSSFGRLGKRLGSLDALASEHGLDLADFDTFTIASWSAGWGLVEWFLRDPETLARLDCLVALDSYYTSKALGRKRGYLAFCERARANDGALCVLSSSTIAGANYPSCDRAVSALLAPLGLTRRDPLPLAYDARLPPAVETQSAGSLFWLRYGETISHGQHATRLGPALFRAVAGPWLSRTEAPGLSGESAAALALVIGAAAAAAYARKR